MVSNGAHGGLLPLGTSEPGKRRAEGCRMGLGVPRGGAETEDRTYMGVPEGMMGQQMDW